MNEIGPERPRTEARPYEHCKECGRLVDDYVTKGESEDGRPPVPRYTCRDCGDPLEWRRIDRARALGREHLMRACRRCGLLSDEFDFFYEGCNGYVGRVYYCRDCLGEEEWHRLAQVPELGPGLFIGRSTRIAQERDPSA
jgi:hypothetical protein